MPPLFKSGTDVPYGEAVAFQGWWAGPGPTLPTYGLWERDLPAHTLNAGFAGRFVYEQSGGAATDGCWYPGSKYLPYTSTLSGGGWFVDQSGDWGPDESGLPSQVDSFYQNYYGPQGQTCEITGPQRLYIDARTGPVPYIVDTQTPAEITPKDLLNGVAPGEGGQAVTACEPYPSIKGKCK